MTKDITPPQKPPTLRVTTRPNDANPNGDIFGGWLMSEIDIAGATEATSVAKDRVATVAVTHLQFINPLFVDDLVSFFTAVDKIGKTSITVNIQVFAQRHRRSDQAYIPIAEATYVYVAIEKPGVKKALQL